MKTVPNDALVGSIFASVMAIVLGVFCFLHVINNLPERHPTDSYRLSVRTVDSVSLLPKMEIVGVPVEFQVYSVISENFGKKDTEYRVRDLGFNHTDMEALIGVPVGLNPKDLSLQEVILSFGGGVPFYSKVNKTTGQKEYYVWARHLKVYGKSGYEPSSQMWIAIREY
jgi:hypothetical protein